MMSPVILEGVAIQLLPLKLDHVEALCGVGLEPRLWQATTIRVLTRTEIESYVRAALGAQRDGMALPFVISERGTGRVIGSTRFHSFSAEHRHLEIGFTWLRLACQRMAINTEAKYLFLRHAFESLGCIRVEFRADSENQQSRRALLRIGAREEGVLCHFRISSHLGVRDLVLYSILK
jgi:RimJ/RimL family protein N-acetyltransferase